MKDNREVVRFLLLLMLFSSVEVVLLLDKSVENGEADGSYPMGQYWCCNCRTREREDDLVRESSGSTQ